MRITGISTHVTGAPRRDPDTGAAAGLPQQRAHFGPLADGRGKRNPDG